MEVENEEGSEEYEGESVDEEDLIPEIILDPVSSTIPSNFYFNHLLELDHWLLRN